MIKDNSNKLSFQVSKEELTKFADAITIVANASEAIDNEQGFDPDELKEAVQTVVSFYADLETENDIIRNWQYRRAVTQLITGESLSEC